MTTQLATRPATIQPTLPLVVPRTIRPRCAARCSLGAVRCRLGSRNRCSVRNAQQVKGIVRKYSARRLA